MDIAKKLEHRLFQNKNPERSSACKKSAFVSRVSVTVDCFEANQQLKYGPNPPAPVTASSTSLQDKAPPAETLLSFLHKQPRAPTGIKTQSGPWLELRVQSETRTPRSHAGALYGASGLLLHRWQPALHRLE